MTGFRNIHTDKSCSRPQRAALGVVLALLLSVFAFLCPVRAYAAPADESSTVPEVTGVQGGAFEVTRYALSAKIRKDHSYAVTEKISVSIPDQLQSIEFAIPSGNFRISGLEVENTAYSMNTALEAGKVSIVDAEKLKEGEHEYTIKYRIQEYEDGDSSKDMFYFNVLLPSWKQPIGSVSIRAEFPDDFPWDDMQCYAGQFGVQDAGSKIHFRADKASRIVTVTGDKIPENYGITLKAQLPDDYWEGALNGSWALAASLASVAGAALILLILWLIGGRDPKVRRVPVTRPVGDLTPVELGYAFNSRVDIRDILHLLICFAEKGYLRISEYEPKRYRLYKENEPEGEEKMYRNAYSILFENVYKGRAVEMEELGGRLERIKNTITDDVAAGFSTSGSSAFTPLSRTFRYIGAAVLGIGTGLANAFSYSYVYMTPNILESIVIAAAAAAAALLLCRQVDNRDSSSIGRERLAELGFGVLFLIPVVYAAVRIYRNTTYMSAGVLTIVMACISMFFMVIMRARGKENAELISRMRSLRSFIYHPTPKEILENYLADKSYYYDMMVYALAFGAEESWAISFLTLDVPEPDWYSDDIEGHAFSNLRERPTTIDYARDLRSFIRTIENAYRDMHRRQR